MPSEPTQQRAASVVVTSAVVIVVIGRGARCCLFVCKGLDSRGRRLDRVISYATYATHLHFSPVSDFFLLFSD